MEDQMFSLGRRLKAIRALYGIEQTELADAIGIDRPRLSDFENGKILLLDKDIQAIGEVLRKKGVQPIHTIEFPIPDSRIACTA